MERNQNCKDELTKKAENFVNRIGNGKQQGFTGYNQVPNLLLQFGGILDLSFKQIAFIMSITSHINSKSNGNGKSKIQWDRSSWVSMETLGYWAAADTEPTVRAIKDSVVADGYFTEKDKKLYPAPLYAALDTLFDLIERYEKDIAKSKNSDRENRAKDIVSSFQENMVSKIKAEYREWAIPRGYLQATLAKEEKKKTDKRKNNPGRKKKQVVNDPF